MRSSRCRAHPRSAALPLLALVALVALVGTGCSTGPTAAPATPPSSAAPVASQAPSGFPTDDDGAALDAAKAFTLKVTSYDHTKLPDQRTAVLGLVGEPLKTQLAKSLADDGDFAKAAVADQRNASGRVLDLGLVTREGNRAVVLLFVDQQLTAPNFDQTQRLRQRVTLTRGANGAWLATKLETV
ncbi:MAG: hypothetical protein QOG60_1733 [Frankiaceae bacterium]|nr:hypothetical protein [Frankiaceae bacterium]MDQ1673044.1 hypothetical protein [Frankiaceae bacterium]